VAQALDPRVLDEALAASLARLPEGTEAFVAVAEAFGGPRAGHGADDPLHAASTMKVAVLIEALRRCAPGPAGGPTPLSPEQEVRLERTFPSIAGGRFTLSPGDDSDPLLYQRLGASAPLCELLERMITRSSNLATNLVLTLVDPREVTATCRRLGAHGVQIVRGVEDAAAFAKGWNNTATAAGLCHLLLALAEGRTPGAALAIEILLRQELPGGLAQGAPAGVRCAHKTGLIRGHAHDVGLLLREGRRPLAVAALTRGFDGEESAQRWIAGLSARLCAGWGAAAPV
jgi:beta-lactamase class A